MPVDALHSAILLPCVIAVFDNSMSQQNTKPEPAELKMKSLNLLLNKNKKVKSFINYNL